MLKKDAAETLYLNGYQLKDIADTMRMNYNTLSKWSSDNNWKQKKAKKALQEKTSQEKIWSLITYQLEIIEKISQLQAEKIKDSEDIKALKEALISRGDIDALQKLFTTIKGKEITWDQIVKLIRELIEHIEDNDFKLAKALVPIANEWMNEKREAL